MTAATGGPVVTTATVASSGTVGAYRVLAMRAPAIAATVQPGQFVEALTPPCLLRRPFSIYRTDRAAGTIAVAYSIIGEGTAWLAARAPGDRVDLIGPLGRGFRLPAQPGVDLIVGGGYGAAALAALAEDLTAAGGTVHAVLGGRDADRVFSDEVLDGTCASIAVTTDDGSRGRRGIVTDPIPSLVRRLGPRSIYACGPMPMLEAVARVGDALGLPTQLAVEEFMACGIGVCWTCVVPVRVDGAIAHRRACTEGPVFAGEEMAWA